jgi:hypothetical protein
LQRCDDFGYINLFEHGKHYIRYSIGENMTRVEIKRIKQVRNQSQNIEVVFQYLDELMEKKEVPAQENELASCLMIYRHNYKLHDLLI